MRIETPWLIGCATRSDMLGAAAHERAARGNGQAPGYRALADRPRARRDREDEQASPRVTVRSRIELRESSGDGTHLEYEGWASVTDEPYEMWDMFGPYTEQVSSGAFHRTLAQVDLDVPFVLQHESLRRIARTTNGSLILDEDEEGLHVLAPQLDPADADVAYIAPKLRSGLVDEMSFKFSITKGSWSPDWTEYHIDEVDLHRGDVAIVGYGANPATSGSLRVAPADLVSRWDDDQARAALTVLQQRFAPAPAPARRSIFTDDDVAIRSL